MEQLKQAINALENEATLRKFNETKLALSRLREYLKKTDLDKKMINALKQAVQHVSFLMKQPSATDASLLQQMSSMAKAIAPNNADVASIFLPTANNQNKTPKQNIGLSFLSGLSKVFKSVASGKDIASAVQAFAGNILEWLFGAVVGSFKKLFTSPTDKLDPKVEAEIDEIPSLAKNFFTNIIGNQTKEHEKLEKERKREERKYNKGVIPKYKMDLERAQEQLKQKDAQILELEKALAAKPKRK